MLSDPTEEAEYGINFYHTDCESPAIAEDESITLGEFSCIFSNSYPQTAKDAIEFLDEIGEIQATDWDSKGRYKFPYGKEFS